MPKLATKILEPQTIPLREGRQLEIADEGVNEVVEIRSASGQLEVRIVLTEEGPVLQLDAVKLSLNAKESVEVDCKRFSVKASEGLALETDGELDTKSAGDTRIVGEKIYLN